MQNISSSKQVETTFTLDFGIKGYFFKDNLAVLISFWCNYLYINLLVICFSGSPTKGRTLSAVL